ncbi:MAG: ATP-binding protein [Acidobacteriota bacterium]
MENKKENQVMEFKPNWRNENLKIISAFANGDGGELMIGVGDKGEPLGLKNSTKLLEDIPNRIRNKLGIIPSIKLEKDRENEIIRIGVNPSSVPISYEGKYYVRSGSTTLALEGSELSNFLMNKSGVTWDDLIEDNAKLEDIDPKTIKEFGSYAMDRLPSIRNEKSVKVILTKLDLQKGTQLKKAAILLFGKRPQKFYLQSQVKIGKFLTETEIVTSDVIKGNLFEQLENTLDVLRTKYLVSPIKFEGIHRREILEYPYEALREALINALIHRNYTSTSSIQIRVFQDKLSIMNEGKLPPEVPVEKLKTEHVSKPRNPLLAKIFYLAGFIESWGRGTLKIVEKCLEQGLPDPDFIEEYGVMKVEFYKDKFTEENLRKMGLNERQIKAVMYVKEKGKITNEAYQEICNIKKRQASIDLKKLEEENILEKIGTTGRGTYYVLKGQKRGKRGN